MNTGGGGGGRGNDGGTGNGGAGGKGVIIIRQPFSNAFPTTLTGSPVTTITATHYIFQFNDSGTIGWAA